MSDREEINQGRPRCADRLEVKGVTYPCQRQGVIRAGGSWWCRDCFANRTEGTK